MNCSMPGFPVRHNFPEFAQTHIHWVSDAIQPFHPLSSLSTALNTSQHHSLFQWVGSTHRMAEVLELQLQYQSFQWIFKLISFRIDCVDLLAVQGTLKSFLQHRSSKASVLRCSAFFIVQLSHLYISVCPIAQGGLDLYKGRVSVQIPSRTLLHTSLVLMKQGRVRGFLPGPFSAERPRKGIGLPTTQACPVWLHTCLWSPKSHSREEISDWLNAPGTVIPHALI